MNHSLEEYPDKEKNLLHIEESIEFWKQLLQSTLHPIQLATKQSFHSNQSEFTLQKQFDLSFQPHFLSSNQHKLYSTFLTLWGTLLYRSSGQEEFFMSISLINQSSSHNESDGLNQTIAPFPMNFTEDRSFVEQIKETDLLYQQMMKPIPSILSKEVNQFLYEHRCNGIEGVRTYFLFQDDYTKNTQQDFFPDFDLGLEIKQEGSRWVGIITYQSQQFEETSIERMIKHFCKLWEGFLSNPQAKMDEIPMLSEEEVHQQVVEWNELKLDESPLCIHEWFELQVRQQPNAEAIRFGNEGISYHELDLRANELANCLRLKGVAPDTLVGVYMERSIDMIIAMLGILKAGGAYVPLDPSYPQERLAFILEDTQASILLTQERLQGRLTGHQAEEIYVDREEDWKTEDVFPTVNAPRVRKENLAYIIYTSGSTGRPKGVAIEHQNAVALIQWAHTVYTPEEMAGVLAGTSICFDLSVFEIFVTFSMGGKVILAENALELPTIPAAHEVTLLNTVPSAARELVRMNSIPSSVQTINLAGEPLYRSLVEQLYETGFIQKVYNLYGPSEDTTYSTYTLVERGKDLPVTIGKPIHNTQAYVLNRHFQPVPIGVPGELYVGGTGVARGYLHRSELTEERFLPNPFAHEDQFARMYRTGDLVRLLPDGNMEYVGRIDHQVKIRGFRIELGEIESCLTKHPDVDEAVVVAREFATGDLRLVAYVTMLDGQDVEPEQWKAFLKELLPEYMVPEIYVKLMEMPLSPNGKIDRKRLPDPFHDRLQDHEATQWETETEEKIAEIWSQLLGIPNLNRQDHFFRLGGHSLLATQFVSAVRERFHIDFPLSQVFEYPTIAELASHLEQFEMEGGSSPIVARDRKEGDFPLSFAQQRLWFLHQLEPQSPVYNLPYAYQIQGSIWLELLEESLQELIQRHSTLRTVFLEQEHIPIQRVLPQVQIPLIRKNLLDVDPSIRETEIMHQLQEEARKPFDLETGPLLRVNVYQMGVEDYILLVTLHHIVTDGWSMEIFFREWLSIYEAKFRGHKVNQSVLPITYTDYTEWQREWMQGDVLEKQLAYWKQKVEGSPFVLDLPTDLPRPPVQSFRGAQKRFHFSPELSKKLTEISQAEGTTLFMTLLSAWSVLLYRYSGQQDFLVGAPIANRVRHEMEELIGFFVNTIVLRMDLTGLPTFRELLQRTKQGSLEAFSNQDIPFEKLVEVLQPERNPSYSPIFQVMFAYQSDMTDALRSSSLPLQPIPVDLGIAKTDLMLELTETKDGLVGMFEYRTDLWEEATIDRMIVHLQHVLEICAENPTVAVNELDFLSNEEKKQILIDWNYANVETESLKCIHHWFEEQAMNQPDEIAIIHGETCLTYSELEVRANLIAEYLRMQGVIKETFVAIYMNRSLSMVVGMLGVLKAGGAYVPLDPAYPIERVHFILEDTQASILLTEEAIVDQLPRFQAKVIDLIQDWDVIEQQTTLSMEKNDDQSEDIELSGPDGNQLAYVIYTSGSTGRPKGVAIEHRNATALIQWAQKVYTQEQMRGVLASTSICFDLSIFELFVTFSMGGTVILVENALELPNLPGHHEVTLINTVPSAMRELLRINAVPASVRTINLAGEPFSRTLADQIYQLESIEQVYNLYGPSEDTTYSTWTLVDRDPNQSITIGRPIYQTQAYVLDAQRKLVPIGVPGELYLGGAGVARGYLNQEELTQDRFLPNPFKHDSTERIYQTGDLVRYLPDGSLEYLGRLDHQVKVRGFRIELGEIEETLMKHAHVHEAVVVAREFPTGDIRLIAYVSANGDQELEIEELQRYLKTFLPEYMVPTIYMQLPALPLTPNKKVDRKALPEPSSQPLISQAIASPETLTEQKIAEIWSQLLGVERVGRDDHFFCLGGHSLLATQLISMIREEFAVDLSVSRVFEHSVLKELAHEIDQIEQGEKVLPLRPRERKGDVPLSFAQQRLWFLQQLEPESPVYHVPYAYQIKGSMDLEVLENSLRQIIQRHSSLRTIFPLQGHEPVQRILPELSISITYVNLEDQIAVNREQVALSYLQEEAKIPFDLENGPLIRANVVRFQEDEHYLLVTMHHMITDGWSNAIFMKEWLAIYEANRTQTEPLLAELPVEYADVSEWQQSWLQGELLDKQLDYWKNHMEGAPLVLDLPTDQPRPPQQTFHGAQKLFTLSPELTKQIRRISETEGTTMYMTLLAAWSALLSRYSSQEELMVGTPIANRTRKEMEGMIGFFVNTLALRMDLTGMPSLRELLQRTRRVALEGFAHQDVPFERVVETVQPERNQSYSPIFQVMFTLQNHTLDNYQAAQLTLQPITLDLGISKFDLLLEMAITSEGLTGVLEYRTELFDEATIDRMVGHFQRLLESGMEQLDAPVAYLDLLTDVEQQQLLVGWNHFEIRDVVHPCIHHWFEEQANRTPDAVALVCGEEQMTYQELQDRSTILARYLRTQGVKPEVLVGIYMNRSLDLIVSLLGVLKAGGAYVPLDPAYPLERISFILQDTQAPIILTEKSLRDQLSELPTTFIVVDQDRERIVQEVSKFNHEEMNESEISVIRGEHLAYIIYTSGSTGRPKGVAIEHRNAVALIKWAQSVYTPEEMAGVLAGTSICFDLSIFELFVTFSMGGKVILAENTLELADLVKLQEITLLNTVPSVMKELVRMNAIPSSVRTINLAGEPLPRTLVDQLYQLATIEKVYNLYGPSEDTTYSTYSLIDRDSKAPVTIGRPIPGTQIYVLDRQMQIVPIGVPGELYLGGAGVTRGYLHREELTNERFVPNPFSEDKRDRMYRTGDLVRYLADGRLEYLGRLDHQVKIRGFRIEIGEIESVLHQHPAVREVVVVIKQTDTEDARLLAFFTTNLDSEPNVGEIYQHLKSYLPEYMIPRNLIRLDEIPLTPNGKVNVQALSKWEIQPTISTTGLEKAPHTDLEKELAHIFCEVLGISKIGLEDNFFELGAHSLLLTRITMLIRENWDIQLSVRVLFTFPTIEELAYTIDQMIKEKNSQTSNSLESMDEHTIQLLLSQFPDLSEEEVDEYLQKLLSEEGMNLDE